MADEKEKWKKEKYHLFGGLESWSFQNQMRNNGDIHVIK